MDQWNKNMNSSYNIQMDHYLTSIQIKQKNNKKMQSTLSIRFDDRLDI